MSSSSSNDELVGPEEKHWAFQLILEDQQEGLEAFRRRHERRQRRLQRDLQRIQQLEAAVANAGGGGGGKADQLLPDQKWKEMEKRQLQQELIIQQQRKIEAKEAKQQQQQQQQELHELQPQLPVRALTSLFQSSRTQISLYPSTADMSTPTAAAEPTTALQRHRSEGWMISRNRDSPSSSGDPLASPFAPQPARPIGWTSVDADGCLVMETTSPSSVQAADLLSVSSSRQQQRRLLRERISPPPITPGCRPAGPDLDDDDEINLRAPSRPSDQISKPPLRPSPRPPSPPQIPQSSPITRAQSSPCTPSSRLPTGKQERLYRKIVPIFPQVPAERIMQLVREQQQQQTNDLDDEENDERRLSTILSILAEESIPLPAEELAGFELKTPSNSTTDSGTQSRPRECQCCYTEWSETDCPVIIPCTGSLHVFCLDCVKKYVEEVVFGNMPIPEKETPSSITDEVAWVLPCMYANTNKSRFSERAGDQDLCCHGLDDIILQHVLPSSLWQRYQEYQVRRALLLASNLDDAVNANGSGNKTDQLQHCPHCGVPCLVALSASPQTMACPSCNKESCWNTSAATATVTTPLAVPNAPSRSNRVETDANSSHNQIEDAGRHYVEEAMTQTMLRNCPKCRRPFVKESGCHKMKCPLCRTASCYVCREVVPWKGYDHFCTHEQPQQHPNGIHCCLECGSTCPLWSPSQDHQGHDDYGVAVPQPMPPAARPISQNRASSRTRRGRRRVNLLNLPAYPSIRMIPPLTAGTDDIARSQSTLNEEEEDLRRRAAWEAAQEVWEQNLLTSGQEVRINVEELVRMPPSTPRPPDSLGPRQWTR